MSPFPILSYLEKKKLIARTLKHWKLRRNDRIVKLLLAPLINIENGEKLWIRGVLSLLLCLRKTTFQNKSASP
jgi:hypothetical protein